MTQQLPHEREVNADRQDPGDPNFIYIGKLIAIRNSVSKNEVRWSRIYLPTKECLEWDKPPRTRTSQLGCGSVGHMRGCT